MSLMWVNSVCKRTSDGATQCKHRFNWLHNLYSSLYYKISCGKASKWERIWNFRTSKRARWIYIIIISMTELENIVTNLKMRPTIRLLTYFESSKGIDGWRIILNWKYARTGSFCTINIQCCQCCSFEFTFDYLEIQIFMKSKSIFDILSIIRWKFGCNVYCYNKK